MPSPTWPARRIDTTGTTLDYSYNRGGSTGPLKTNWPTIFQVFAGQLAWAILDGAVAATPTGYDTFFYWQQMQANAWLPPATAREAVPPFIASWFAGLPANLLPDIGRIRRIQDTMTLGVAPAPAGGQWDADPGIVTQGLSAAINDDPASVIFILKTQENGIAAGASLPLPYPEVPTGGYYYYDAQASPKLKVLSSPIGPGNYSTDVIVDPVTGISTPRDPSRVTTYTGIRPTDAQVLAQSTYQNPNPQPGTVGQVTPGASDIVQRVVAPTGAPTASMLLPVLFLVGLVAIVFLWARSTRPRR